MSWFGLDSQSVAQRVHAAGSEPTEPSLSAFLLRGTLGFTLVSVAGFAPWALGGRWLHRTVGELGMYVACALVFIGLSGLLLHQLILGPGSLSRFYKLFSMAFTTYAVGWIAGYMLLRGYLGGHLGGHLGGVVGLLAGTAAMGWIFCRAFDARGRLLPVIAALFVLNALGYFVGGWVEAWMVGSGGRALISDGATRLTIAMLSWGVLYGLGLGAGLGFAFYLCQTGRQAVFAPEQSKGTGAAVV